jgi:hypothetical protein
MNHTMTTSINLLKENMIDTDRYIYIYIYIYCILVITVGDNSTLHSGDNQGSNQRENHS